MIKIEELDCWDLTWFAYDDAGRLAVFFSNGTNSVLTNHILKERNYELAFEYFNTLKINTNIFDIKNFENNDIEDFLFYAQRGLLVYDIDNSKQSNYNLVIKPAITLMIDDIDEKVSEIIEKYEGFFSDFIEINPS